MYEIKFETRVAAFDDMPQQEIARILEKAAEFVRNSDPGFVHSVLDINGNSIGTMSWEAENE